MLILDYEQVRSIIYNNKNKFYTYVLIRNDNTPFYIGVGIRNRVLRHVSNYELINSSNLHKNNLIKKELENFGKIKYAIVRVSSCRSVCLNTEKDLIKKLGKSSLGGSLVNLTDGGEIGPNGTIISEETRLKHKLRVQRNRDILSDKSKQWWKNLSEEEKNHRVARMRCKSKDLNVLDKISKSSKDRWNDPEYRKRLSAKQKESQLKISRIHSDTMKAKWNDPEFRAMMLEKRRLARLQKLNKN